MARSRPRSVVVVGAGLAGAQALAALRAQGFEGTATVLGDEGLAPYDRPPLSKELLERTEPVWLADEVGAQVDLADDVRLDEAATGLTVQDDHVVVTTTRGTVRADAVVLATGARAWSPWPDALTLRSARDAQTLRDQLTPGARLTVVGAGWVGAEVAGVAAAAGVEVTVVEGGPSPLAGPVGPRVGALTTPWYAAAGVRLLLGTPVRDLQGRTVHLQDGSRIDGDVTLVATGARAASRWLDGTVALRQDGSVPVDAHQRVLTAPGPLPHVVAVGDVAARRSPRHGWVPGGHWDAALRGPTVAVQALLDPEGARTTTPPDPAPYVFSTQLGHHLTCHGLPSPGHEVVLRGDPNGAFSALWFTEGDELAAVLTVDRPRDVAAARKLFTGPHLPRVPREQVADTDVPLRAAG